MAKYPVHSSCFSIFVVRVYIWVINVFDSLLELLSLCDCSGEPYSIRCDCDHLTLEAPMGSKVERSRDDGM